MKEKHWRKSHSILTASCVRYDDFYLQQSHNFQLFCDFHLLSESVKYLHFSSELFFSCLTFSTATKYFPSLFLLKLPWTARYSWPATLTDTFDKIWRCLSWCQLKNCWCYCTRIQHYFHSYDIVEADFFGMAAFNH